MYRYKPEEGRNARQAAFWLGEGMIVYGCFALRGTLDRWEGLRAPLLESFESLPILGVTLNGSFLGALGVFLLLTWLLVGKLAVEKNADKLIEVETEMKKVTWPTFKEASNSSIVVVSTVLILMGFLAFSDAVLGRLFNFILWKEVGE
ncbi:MAG TPA: preprotein translocase subunit SecE [Planctomycetota bacterium]|jgi:preprotein translocase SecE subunit|nr:preprotein translocase subunit SecE [Planctomycetota bacterium]MDP7246008.1 preprotein translocase subunit SecE [Planctomycetota bacterium]MDP7560876.1 preprotein translocase subunit SecE [Planctomycetota bacterium]HJM39660.1 preprotein translocase subunit SecE [Planctomycetota bacterium]|tara:strand:+ start:32305 stop:32748 length:444 start_codon:yes stop_codon:yes gene_type:complete